MIVSFTPIRSQSKGIKDKNIRLLNGKPLFHHVVLEAQKVSALSEVWVSTESYHYASLAPAGVKIHNRSKESASDESPTAEVLLEFIKTHPDVATIIVLQATSPTTTAQDIEEAIQHSATGKGCVSVKPVHMNLYEGNEPLWTTRKRRQDSNTFAEDGSIYVVHVKDFLKTKSIPTLPCQTMVLKHPVCDIDTEEDFEHASILLKETSSAVIDIGGTYVRLMSKNRTESWRTETLSTYPLQLKDFIMSIVQTVEEKNICISTCGKVIEEEAYYMVSSESESNPIPHFKDVTIPKIFDGKCIKLQNDGDCAVMELVRRLHLQCQNILLLVFGTGIGTGLYINGRVVINAEIGRVLEPQFSKHFESSDPLKLAQELTNIKIMLSLDEVYVCGFINKHKYHIEILEQHGIKALDLYLNRGGALQIPFKKQFQQKRTMVIAEIGYNHQGDVDIAKQLIRECKDAGVDVVKLQKQDLSANGRFTPAVLQRPYVSKNSFGKTYGDHRRALELSKEDFKVLKTYAKECEISFTSSGHDKPSFDFLEHLNVPLYKISSGDIGNLELIEYVAKKGKPVILSTGMSDMTTVEKSVQAVLKHNQDLTLLQCTSSYPVPDGEVQLNVIRTYKKMFPNIKIGFSGHDQGMALTLAAAALGCEVVEKHVTLDKQMKGSDHVASLDMQELKTLVQDIRRIDDALGSGVKCIQPSENEVIKKLGKCLVYKRSFLSGSIITPNDVVAKVSHKTAEDVPIHETNWQFRELLTNVSMNENMKTNHLKCLPATSEKTAASSTTNAIQGFVFVTCTRADFSKLAPLIFEALNTNATVSIWVSGMHLQKEFGSTYLDVVRTFSSTRAKIFLKPNDAKINSQTFIKTADAFQHFIEPSADMVFVHGDRLESLACTIVAVSQNIRVCHIEGGEKSGTLDESLRHAITKLSHLHIVSNQCSRKRLLQLGESDERIHVIGSPEVDSLLENNVSFADVKELYEISFEDRDYMILLFHPITINFDPNEIRHIVSCCISSGLNFVVIKCNNDTNYESVLKEYERFENNHHFKYILSLRHEYFIALLKHSNGLVGNSSAGVRETPVLGIPSLNIGNRQKNRSFSAKSVIHIPDYRDMTDASLLKLNGTSRFEPFVEFGSRGCAHRFSEFLCKINSSNISLQKHFVDIHS